MATVTGRWLWGWRVTTLNQIIDFECATHAGSYQATLRLGDYTPGQFATEVARAMNAAHPGAGDAFTCVFDFTTRKFTIDNGVRLLTLRFDLNPTINAAGLLGFDVATTGSASGHTSTDTVGNTSAPTYFLTAGVKSWAPLDPAVNVSPSSPAADGTTWALLQRHPRTIQHETDGGLRESIHFSTDKKYVVEYKMLTAAEQVNMEALLDWLEQGAPVNFRPDDTAGSTIAMRLVLDGPGDIQNSFSFLALPHADYPTLVFVEQLNRT